MYQPERQHRIGVELLGGVAGKRLDGRTHIVVSKRWVELVAEDDVPSVLGQKPESLLALAQLPLSKLAFGHVAHDAQDLSQTTGHQARLEVQHAVRHGETVFDDLRLTLVERPGYGIQHRVGQFRRHNLAQVAADELFGWDVQISFISGPEVQVLAVAADAEHQVGDGLEHRPVPALAPQEFFLGKLAPGDIFVGDHGPLRVAHEKAHNPPDEPAPFAGGVARILKSELLTLSQ